LPARDQPVSFRVLGENRRDAKRESTARPAEGSVVAVVVTHRRPRLAGDLVRSLVGTEGFAPDKIVVVVSGEGGLDDLELEATVHMVRLTSNLGPAGAFRVGLLRAFEDPSVNWAYLCEDDVGLFPFPTPRVAHLVETLEGRADLSRIGAVVSYGRRFIGRGHTVNVVPLHSDPSLMPVDVAAWGATLVSRAVVDRGVLPTPEWFFGFEDFDFFCRIRAAGLAVLVDSASARALASHQTSSGRNAVLSTARPTDSEEPWRAYYVARNFFHLTRAHGTPVWLAWHLLYSARRLQLAPSSAERIATLHGLLDGARGRLGAHPAYLRKTGERGDFPPE
jgi:GT2 family glycosyltransferase